MDFWAPGMSVGGKAERFSEKNGWILFHPMGAPLPFHHANATGSMSQLSHNCAHFWHLWGFELKLRRILCGPSVCRLKQCFHAKFTISPSHPLSGLFWECMTQTWTNDLGCFLGHLFPPFILCYWQHFQTPHQFSCSFGKAIQGI